MNKFYNYFTDYFSKEARKYSDAIIDSLLPNHLQQLSIRMEESQNVSKYTWKVDGEKVKIYI